MWYRQGQTATPQYKDQLVFDPISREQAGDYVCAAENSVGRSEEEMTTVTVLCKYSFNSPLSVNVNYLAK